MPPPPTLPQAPSPLRVVLEDPPGNSCVGGGDLSCPSRCLPCPPPRLHLLGALEAAHLLASLPVRVFRVTGECPLGNHEGALQV